MQNFMKTILSGVQTWTKGKIKDSTADWNQDNPNADNYVKNRTHYDTRILEEVNITFDGVLDGKEYLDLNGDGLNYMVKVSDLTPSIEEVIGGIFSYTINGGEMIDNIKIEEPYIAQVSNTLYDIDGGIVIALENTSINSLVFTKGIWHMYCPTINSWYSNLHYTRILSGEFKKLDSKYLDIPENIATIDDVQMAIETKMDVNDPVGYGSFSMNRLNNSVKGVYSHAEGLNTIASGGCSHAEGTGLTNSYRITGDANATKYTLGMSTPINLVGRIIRYNQNFATITAHDRNTRTITVSSTLSSSKLSSKLAYIYGHASGSNSHTEGEGTLAIGENSHAEGGLTIASGVDSHAEGWCTEANGSSSHAEGYYTNAYSKNQHVQGKYNIIPETTSSSDNEPEYAHIVGNGTKIDARSNAHTLDWEGNAWYAGDVYVGSTSGTNRDEGSKKLITMSDIKPNILPLFDDWYSLENGMEIPYPTDYSFGTYYNSLASGVTTIFKVGYEELDIVKADGGSIYLNGDNVFAVTYYSSDNIYLSFDADMSTKVVLQLNESGIFVSLETIGMSGNGASITGATVGQTIKISAVDDNGVPTAWEPVDPFVLTDEKTGIKYKLSVVDGKLTIDAVSEV